MERDKDLWAVVLAAGEGNRLRSLTTDKEGMWVPKQFCSIDGGPSMLRSALERATRIVPREKIVTIVAAGHSRWWESELRDFPQENIIVQPKNRGTAAGILLPVLHIFHRARGAKILVLPSDHAVTDEDILRESVEGAVPSANGVFNRMILLGIQADRPETEYGWIVPASAAKGSVGSLERVGFFVEKPPREAAIDLMRRGGLWNSFMLLGSASTYLRLYRRTQSELLWRLLIGLSDSTRRWRSDRLAAVYDGLPTLDFSRDILQRDVSHLWVLRVPPCGWNDLGTPERVAGRDLRIPPGVSCSPGVMTSIMVADARRG